ncbi:MAG TPA: hypothetical protein VFI39_06065, partial [Gemmatimonadales bacterium]|nr:hypothetical protein [Gemmatimonadales bacterium]
MSDAVLFWVVPFTIAETVMSPDRVAVKVQVRLLLAHPSAGSGNCHSRMGTGTGIPAKVGGSTIARAVTTVPESATVGSALSVRVAFSGRITICSDPLQV